MAISLGFVVLASKMLKSVAPSPDPSLLQDLMRQTQVSVRVAAGNGIGMDGEFRIGLAVQGLQA